MILTRLPTDIDGPGQESVLFTRARGCAYVRARETHRLALADDGAPHLPLLGVSASV